MKYQGYRSWNAYNVSLWMNNDERIYKFALECLRSTLSIRYAVNKFMARYGYTKTPDGAVYNTRTVRESLLELRVGIGNNPEE